MNSHKQKFADGTRVEITQSAFKYDLGTVVGFLPGSYLPYDIKLDGGDVVYFGENELKLHIEGLDENE